MGRPCRQLRALEKDESADSSPHPFRDVLPWAIVAGVCLGLGLVLAKLTWARSVYGVTLALRAFFVEGTELINRFRWLRLPSRLLWLTGLGSLLYTTILVAPRQLALILLVSIFTVAVPLLLILATMYVFRTPPSVTSTTRYARSSSRCVPS